MGAHRSFYLNKEDRKIMGVCAGLSELTRIDVTLIRVVTIISTVMVGLPLFAYLLLGVLTPFGPPMHGRDAGAP